MRPHDIVILLKISVIGTTDWYVKDLASGLGISQSETSESLNRSYLAGFLSWHDRELIHESVLEFLEHGIRYVYPHQPVDGGSGMPTAFSARALKRLTGTKARPKRSHIWRHPDFNHRGQVVIPLHPGVPEACRKDRDLYRLLALVDVLRVSNSKDHRELAVKELRNRI
jgi:hypothetical protein